MGGTPPSWEITHDKIEGTPPIWGPPKWKSNMPFGGPPQLD